MSNQQLQSQLNKEYYPLTIPQQNIFSIRKCTPFRKYEKEALGFYFLVKGDADEEILEKSFNRLVYENDSLRIRFKIRTAWNVKQYIEDYRYESVDRIKVKDWAACKKKMIEYKTSFPISTKSHEKQYRAAIITFDEGAALLVIVSHYCFDGYSIVLAVNKLAKYYETFEKGESPAEPDSRFSIKNYISANVDYSKSQRYRDNVKYWKNELKKRPNIGFPIRKRKLNSLAKNIKRIIDGETYRKLLDISEKNNIPVTFLITSMIGYTMFDITGCRCFNIASNQHSRITFSQKNTIGCMHNTFLHFFDIDPEQNMIEYIKENALEYLDNMRHGEIDAQRIFFIGLGRALKKFNLSYFGLLLSILDLNGIDIDEERFGYWFVTDNDDRANQLYVSVTDNYNDEIEIFLSYQESLFNDDEIQEMEKVFMANIDKLIKQGE